MTDTTSLIGQRFGRLVVIGYAYADRSRPNATYQYWRVRCDCGTEFNVVKGSLTSGGTRSCGCLRKETIREIGKKYRESLLNVKDRID